MDEQNNDSSVILVYYRFRGMAQNIRYILFYLNLAFKQILVDHGQELSSLTILKKHRFQTEVELPYLIDGNYLIQNCFAIIRHLCTKVGRQDLLGSSLQERTIIREIYYNFMLKKKKTIKLLFKFGQQTLRFPHKTEQIRKQAMMLCHKQSGSLIQTSTLKLRNPNQRYIFDHITVLDFLFYEQSFYQVNLFGNLEQKNCKLFLAINSLFGTDLNCVKNKNAIHLRVMREFKEGFENEPFYMNNRTQLQSYNVISPSMGNFAKESFKKVWLGPQHYLQQKNP